MNGTKQFISKETVAIMNEKKISFIHGSRISFSMAAAINTSMKLAATSLGLAVRLGLLKLACWQSLVPSVDFEVNHLHFSMCTTSKSWKPASQDHVCTRESLVNTIVENKLWWTTDHVLSPFNSPRDCHGYIEIKEMHTSLVRPKRSKQSATTWAKYCPSCLCLRLKSESV